MTHGSLFSGIGGFDLAAEWAGWTNVFHCEYEPFAQKILKHHFPNSKLYNDVRTFDATAYAGRIDILTGGFPCQPFSSAGERKGTEDERHLWPQMLRVIREVAPKYVVGENVRGLINWSGGLVFEQVCADLEAEGYEVQPYLLPACGKNAPHRRDRIWFIAYASDSKQRQNGRTSEEKTRKIRRDDERIVPDGSVSNGNATDSNSERRKRSETRQRSEDKKPSERLEKLHILSKKRWHKFPTKPPICGGDDGIPRKLDGITFPGWRRKSIAAYGNAIVPQVAYEIFKAINKLEETNIVS